jgi:hypothetical protein
MCIAVEQEVEERKRKKSEEIQETGRVVQANRSTFQEIKGAERERVRESSREREKEREAKHGEFQSSRRVHQTELKTEGTPMSFKSRVTEHTNTNTHTSKWPETALVSAEWPVAL